VRCRIAVSPVAGRKTLRLQVPGTVGIPVELAKALSATCDGCSLNAAVACGAAERK